MRWLAIALVVLVIHAAVLADPVRPERPAAPPLEPREAREFAVQLRDIILLVSQQYIRPLPPAEIAGAALHGLYDAAAIRLPATLPAELAQLGDDERQLHHLLYEARLQLGNRPELVGTRALVVSLEAIVQALDPYCTLLTGAEVARTRNVAVNYGIGLEVAENPTSGPWLVKAVALGSPAQKAGIQPGDRILQVAGAATSTDVARIFGSNHRSPVTLTFVGRGQAGERTMTLRPEQFHAETILGVRRLEDNSWDYFLDRQRRIAHVRVTRFDAGTAQELAGVLAELHATRVRGLILDLRWSPGGYLDEARDAADLFLGHYNTAFFVLPTPANWLALADVHLDDHCQNATVVYRSGQPDERVQQTDAAFSGIPLVVLVNAETAGGAELVAAVLQDNLRARVAGERTRGKASVQRIIHLSGQDGSLPRNFPLPDTALKLSAGLLIRPSGKNLNRFADSKPADSWGVRPDPGLEFRLSADFAARLHALWQQQDLRPGANKHGLPLDDPDADPQRQAALAALLELLK
jgi:carboxyl-terminal processing protease